MAARRADSDQRSARGADFRPRLLVAAAEQSAHRVLPFSRAPLPSIGKRQFSSLRPAHRVPIIPKSPWREEERRLGYYRNAVRGPQGGELALPYRWQWRAGKWKNAMRGFFGGGDQ